MLRIILTGLLTLTLAPSALARQAGQGRGVGVRQQPQGVTQAPAVQALPERAKRWALVVGVDSYADRQINRLSGAARDARSLGDALTRYAGFPSDQVILLTTDESGERQPTRSNILKYLSNLRGLVPKDGLFLLFFAGHGIERGGRSFLMPSDALGNNDVTLLEDTAVDVERVKALIRATEVRQVILVLDNCRNDPAAGRGDADNLMTESFRRSFNFDLRNRQVQAFATLYATEVGSRAYEYAEKQQGYFTWALVEGLKGGAADERGEVTLARLVKYVQDSVPKLVQRDLGAGSRQRPFATIEGYRADELVLAVAHPATTTASSAEAAALPPPATPPKRNKAAELAYWATIAESKDPEDFRAYLRKYPDGDFAELAQIRLRGMESAPKAEPTPAPPVPAASAAAAGPELYQFGVQLKQGKLKHASGVLYFYPSRVVFRDPQRPENDLNFRCSEIVSAEKNDSYAFRLRTSDREYNFGTVRNASRIAEAFQQACH